MIKDTIKVRLRSIYIKNLIPLVDYNTDSLAVGVFFAPR